MIEYVYHVDEEDNVIGKVTREEMRKKNLYHRSIAVLVFNSNDELLVHKRTETKDIHPGEYDLKVSGGVDFGETYEEAALRELEEEIGAKGVELELLFTHKNQEHHDNCFVKVYKTKFDGLVIPQESEIEWIKFVPVSEVEEFISNHKVTPGGILDFREYMENEKSIGSR